MNLDSTEGRSSARHGYMLTGPERAQFYIHPCGHDALCSKIPLSLAKKGARLKRLFLLVCVMCVLAVLALPALAQEWSAEQLDLPESIF